jgi:CheY-like chemotaxis protein
MDGMALARRAREMLPLLPVIYASAGLPTQDAEARVPGAIFLRKPYEPEAAGRLLAGLVKPAGVAIPA